MYLGVDGGGTKTTFTIINEKGELKASIRIGTLHYVQVGFDGFSKNLEKGIKLSCEQAKIEQEDLKFSFFGLPAFGEVKSAAEKMKKIVKKIMNSDDFYCGNDVEAGWAGSLAGKAGINIVAGTGSIGYGKDRKNQGARSGGWGFFCGDEGSAYWLGKKLISYFTKEADGRLEKTELYYILRKELNLEADFEIINLIYNEFEFKRDKIASLAKLLSKAAEKGDIYALKLYQEAAYEYSLIIKAITKKLNFDSAEKITVSYSGGVFKAEQFVLNPLKNYLDSDRYELQSPILNPGLGSAFYALILNEGYKNYDKKLKRLQKTSKSFQPQIK